MTKQYSKQIFWVLAILLGVLFLDQCVKIWVKTNMQYGEEFLLMGLSWARIHFVENKGMAFGLSFGGDTGKLLLSLFRIFAVGFIIYIIRQLILNREKLGIIICFTLILAGALGNIIDSVFYGVIFSESPYHGGYAELFPEDGGYSTFLHGEVVDMLYFPLFTLDLPTWLPIWGGQPFEFFRPVFNIADSAISIGIIALLLFYRNFFTSEEEKEEDPEVLPTTE